MLSLNAAPARIALALARWIRAGLSPHDRAVRAALRAHPARMFQPAGDTRPDRHPRLFAFVADQLREVAHPKVLSFGCSTGEEALTLASYFPSGSIDGIDVNRRSIRLARRLARAHGAAATEFTCRDTVPAGLPRYDAIFCLSVFRHGDLDRRRPPCSSAHIPFDRFDAAVVDLEAALRPGGLLCIWGANFRLADTSVAGRFRPLIVPGKPTQRGAIYGRGDRLLPIDVIDRFVFRKLA